MGGGLLHPKLKPVKKFGGEAPCPPLTAYDNALHCYLPKSKCFESVGVRDSDVDCLMCCSLMVLQECVREFIIATG